MTAAEYVWPDYARMDAARRAHHARYVRYVAAHGLVCQECGGSGECLEEYHDLGGGAMYPRYDGCGWCECTGKVTAHRRAEWLRWRRQCKRMDTERKRRLANAS